MSLAAASTWRDLCRASAEEPPLCSSSTRGCVHRRNQVSGWCRESVLIDADEGDGNRDNLFHYMISLLHSKLISCDILSPKSYKQIGWFHFNFHQLCLDEMDYCRLLFRYSLALLFHSEIKEKKRFADIHLQINSYLSLDENNPHWGQRLETRTSYWKSETILICLSMASATDKAIDFHCHSSSRRKNHSADARERERRSNRWCDNVLVMRF